ncbi:MAG: hypothetical protein IIA87_01365 [Nanoarchaeota archaeon]|nr:hypothetical protein [Nanoarchaeota archaeon]
MRALEVLFIILLLGLLGSSVYFLYLNFPGEKIEFIPVSENNKNRIEYNNKIYANRSTQFFQNMRFPEKRISYKIENECDLKKRGQVLEALKIFEGRTVLTFYPSDMNPEIVVTCSDLAPDPEAKGHFVAGEGGPVEVINTSLYSVIFSGKISLFRDDKCKEPRVSVHELFHVFGFDHNNNPNSILYPTLDCEQKIDQYLIDEINRLYSVKGMPDLKVENIEASKAGRYLSFEIEVLNQGLKDAKDVMLSIYSDEVFVEKFELNDIDVGTKKILTVENLKIRRSSKNVVFIVDEKNRIDEIFEDNNKVELVISSS